MDFSSAGIGFPRDQAPVFGDNDPTLNSQQTPVFQRVLRFLEAKRAKKQGFLLEFIHGPGGTGKSYLARKIV